MTQPLILLGLNEVNFDYVQHYAREGKLPGFRKLFETAPVVRTSSEKAYRELEPWIQWVSIQTGKSFSEHGIFRLGDVAGAQHTQIWEHLEKEYGVKVGAISPMNAANRTTAPAFFVPDPWTRTRTDGNWLVRGLSRAVANAVNENATGGSKLSTYFFVLLGVLRYSLARRKFAVVMQVIRALRTHYQRAILLDQLLADMFCDLWETDKPGFSSLFLNGSAHLQHHYLFNSACYAGANRNPQWYMPQGRDPVLEGYRAYDQIVTQILALPGSPRVLIVTGLHQNPVEQPVFYWRLKDHADFLRRMGFAHKDVQARMSRDFLITFASADEAAAAEAALKSCRDAQGTELFGEIENRGDSLFVSLTYPHDIREGFAVTFGEGRKIRDFNEMVAFVALKNGEHDGEGYLVDSAGQVPAGEAFPITGIFGLIDRHFAQDKAALKAAA